MARKLSHEDSRAIDMLLDQNGQVPVMSADSIVGSSNVKSSKMNMKTRLRAADRMLRMLSHMPAAEPSQDLVRRTLQRIDDAPVMPAILGQPDRYVRSDNRPHA